MHGSALLFFLTQQYICTYKYIHIYIYNILMATCQLKHIDPCEHILSQRVNIGAQMEACSFSMADKAT